MLCIFFPSSILKWLHKNSPILMGFFFLHDAGMTAATVQCNKIVLNEIKDNLSSTRALVWKKLN